MNARENIKNEEVKGQAYALTDLAANDEQADRATGGAMFEGQGGLLVSTEGGIW